MSRNIHLGLILGIGLCSGLSAEITDTSQTHSDTVCGQDIRMHDVLVLDLEPMRNDPDMAQSFVDERVGDPRESKIRVMRSLLWGRGLQAINREVRCYYARVCAEP